MRKPSVLIVTPALADARNGNWQTARRWAKLLAAQFSVRLAQAWDVAPDASPLVRAEKARPPSDDAIFKAGVWGLTSFMAREGLTGAEDGLGEFFHALMTYFDGPNAPSDERLDAYLRRKARAKARRYNVRVDDHDEG